MGHARKLYYRADQIIYQVSQPIHSLITILYLIVIIYLYLPKSFLLFLAYFLINYKPTVLHHGFVLEIHAILQRIAINCHAPLLHVNQTVNLRLECSIFILLYQLQRARFFLLAWRLLVLVFYDNYCAFLCSLNWER